MSSDRQKVPVVVTLDVHDQPRIDSYLDQSVDVLAQMGIKATYFVPADVFRQHRPQMARISQYHQLACHGLYHDGEEAYDRIPRAAQRDYINGATMILEDGLGYHPGAFRTPGFKISGATVDLLQEFGYYADVSVNSGRLAITSTYGRENGMFRAPRLPYHPSRDNPYQEGDLQLWEIPVSAFLIPLTSNSAVVLGKHLARVFARTLLLESRITPKPLVFMSHPEDICRNGPDHERRDFSWRMLLPTEHGIVLRHYLAARSAQDFYEVNCALIKSLQKAPATEFLTVEGYVYRYLAKRTGEELVNRAPA